MNKPFLIVCGLLVLALVVWQFPSNAPQAPQTPQANPPGLDRFLDYGDQHYDSAPAMLSVPFHSSGYHSRFETGVEIHPTRESLYYAAGLFQRGGDEDANRANRILRTVLPLQQTNPAQKAYGVWPWLLEEPLEEMSSVDLNWADFCASALAQILVQHRQQLADRSLVSQTKAALKHAAIAIRKRDVGPGYSNIAVLGGGVCAIAGELLDDPALLDYGRDRLLAVAALTKTIDGFTEYNSPTYGKVVIGECERILQLSSDSETRAAAETIRIAAWRMIADSFHSPTQQWAGPHSRFSQRRLTTTMVKFLTHRTGLGLAPHPRAIQERPRGYGIVTPLPCPSELLDKMNLAHASTIKRVFKLDRNGQPEITGTTWMDEKACLGSVDRSSLWTQRKPVSGYWQTEDDPAVAFRIRFLRDGKDFASMGIRTTQKDNQVLCVVHSLQNRGDWHRSLDRPEDGQFSASDFRLRLEIEGVGATAVQLTGDRFALRAGDREVAIFPAESQFLGEPVRWEREQGEGGENFAAIDGVCFSGPQSEFDFSEAVDMALAVAIELRETDSDSSAKLPILLTQPKRMNASWQGLETSAPR